MNDISRAAGSPATGSPVVLPTQRGLFYGGGWHDALGGRTADISSPSTGQLLATVADGGAADVDAAVTAAQAGFKEWRRIVPLQRARILREMAAVLRRNGRELAMLDAADSGNPVRELLGDVEMAAGLMEFFAGMVTEMKGASIPMGPNIVNFSVREPRGVVARVIPFNHPLMFCAAKSAAPLAAGNSVIVKPPEQAPLSAMRMAELVGDLMPPGTFNVLPGGRDVGAALSAHPGVAMIALIGSVATGRAVMRSAAETIKPVLLELGGKNALIAFPDADPATVAAAAVAGMNFSWCGQSCGSTSRAFVHAAIHDEVVERIAAGMERFRPGISTDMATTMGALASSIQRDRVLHYINSARTEGARLICGGGTPDDPALSDGMFIEATVFADVTADMTIAREEIFGPVLSILRWEDEAAMLEEVNRPAFGLTCSIWTNDLHRAHRTAADVEAGYVWINDVAKHFLGTPFGGYKQSGVGREECLEELLAFTQEKNIHVRYRAG